MSNNSAENGGVDPRSAQQIIPDGDQPLVQDFLGLVGNGMYLPDPSQNGNLYAIPGQSAIINGEPMIDTQQEAPNSVAPEVLINPDGDLINRLKDEFAAIAETGAGPGMNEAHGIVLESIYPPLLVKTLDELLNAAQVAGNTEGSAEARAAIQALDTSLDIVRALAQGRSMYRAFRRADNLYSIGEGKLVSAMVSARELAIKCYEKHSQTIADPDAKIQASEMYRSYRERKDGVKLPQSFVDRLFDPNTKVLAIQLDFNSTLNSGESYPNPPINKLAQDAIEMLIETFEDNFPDKEISISINTGRPAQYAWGVHEASMLALPQVRKFAFAESGGVIVTNLESGATEIAVENPQQWQRELDGIEAHIRRGLANPRDMMVEKKESMKSIKLAQPHGGEFILKTKDGQPATPEWMAQQVEDYFLITQSELGAEFEALMLDLEKRFPETHRYIVDHLNGNGQDIPLNQGSGQQPESVANGNGEFISKRSQVLKTLRTVFGMAETGLQERIDAIDTRLDTIDIMHLQGLLQAKYNPRAGYIDIGHAHLNKYSTSMKKICEEFGVTRDQVLWAIIGDSTTDIIPTDLTNPGEPNEGANNAYMVAVRERNRNMEKALKERGDHGIDTNNSATNAVIAFARGVENVINPPKKVDPQ